MDMENLSYQKAGSSVRNFSKSLWMLAPHSFFAKLTTSPLWFATYSCKAIRNILCLLMSSPLMLSIFCNMLGGTLMVTFVLFSGVGIVIIRIYTWIYYLSFKKRSTLTHIKNPLLILSIQLYLIFIICSSYTPRYPTVLDLSPCLTICKSLMLLASNVWLI